MDKYDYYEKIEEILNIADSKLSNENFEWLLEQIKDTIENID